MEKPPFGGSALTLHTLLAERKAQFRVPEFQRNYVWTTTKEIPRFWNYLTKGRTGEGAQPIFLGALVLHLIRDSDIDNPTHYHVIDGQQRLMTIFLFLTAIAECYQDIDMPNRTENVETSYLLHNLSDYRACPMLSSSINDTLQFNKALRVLANPTLDLPGDTGDASGQLTTGWVWIRDRVREFSRVDEGNPEQTAGLLSDLLSALVYRTWVGILTIRDQANAHQAFQRLNADGIRLTTIDLIRNAVFTVLTTSDSSKLGHFYATRWYPFEAALGDQESDYWYSLAVVRDKSTTKSSVFDSLQERWLSGDFRMGRTGDELANLMVEDLEEFTTAFRGITGLEKPSTIDQGSWRALRRLLRAELPTMTYAFFFELINRRLACELSSEEFSLQCEIVESVLARRVLRGKEMGGVQGVFKPLLGKDLTGEELIREFAQKNRFGSDEEIRGDILTKALYSMSRHRFVMGEYERWQKGGKKLNPKDKGNDYHVDHVMPENPRWNDWPGLTRAEHSMYLHTWGNLVFLSQSENLEKSAKGFADARPALLEPGALHFRSTGQLIKDNQEWGIGAIQGRSAQLAEWAIMRWPSTIEGFLDKDRAKRLVAAD